MKKLRLFKLRYNILLRKFFLNLMLGYISPTNKLVIVISQNLDKYIISYQKELFIEYSLKSIDEVI